MGSTLLIGSCEPFSGKSALVLGIARHLRSAGARVLFGKPLATSLDLEPGSGTPPSPLIDDDVRFVGETLGLEEHDLLPSLHLLSAHSGQQRLAEDLLTQWFLKTDPGGGGGGGKGGDGGRPRGKDDEEEKEEEEEGEDNDQEEDRGVPQPGTMPIKR